jgi:MoaA/NifB/PqqE/SkfB family radical SAM enzyme/spore coat polysaccharide biosynthesis protein SpsF (cytidylyltransferase family)
VKPVAAVLSMLHEQSGARHSAARRFRDKPVLDWTLRRLRRAKSIERIAILCWQDQADAARPIAEAHNSIVIDKGVRCAIPIMDNVTAARRWADGWRGGLLQTCEFDRGFLAPWFVEAATVLESDPVIIIDSAAGLVDPELIDLTAQQAEEHASRPLIFSQAAPGLCGIVIRRSLLQQLAQVKSHAGKFLHYLPNQPSRDPISEANCVSIPAPIARSTQRFTLDSPRQIKRLSRATEHLNGQLIVTGAEELVQLGAKAGADEFPREIVLELNTRRATKPIFSPLAADQIDRPDLSLQTAKKIFTELGPIEDARLTLGGVGDPLLAPQCGEIVAAAHDAGINAIQVRTDLLDLTVQQLEALIEWPIDVISVSIPAVTARTYLAMMGADGLAKVLENVRKLVELRFARKRGTPLLVPVFVKCKENLAEMETWYDKWLPTLGSAVITGPSDFAGLIVDHSVADMTPPLRRPCQRLQTKMHILSDGRIVACDQDVLGKHPLGHADRDSILDVWKNQCGVMRNNHACGNWSASSICGSCKQWHRL